MDHVVVSRFVHFIFFFFILFFLSQNRYQRKTAFVVVEPAIVALAEAYNCSDGRQFCGFYFPISRTVSNISRKNRFRDNVKIREKQRKTT